MRSKRLQIAGVDAHIANQSLHRSLDAYRDARHAGLQPEGVHRHQVEDAWRKTEEAGTPYRADAR